MCVCREPDGSVVTVSVSEDVHVSVGVWGQSVWICKVSLSVLY